MDRLERIRAKRASLDAEALEKHLQMNNKVFTLANEIKGLESRLGEMFKVADEMVKQRISFGGTHYHLGMDFGDNFETNGIDHNIGFVFKYEEGRGRSTNLKYRLGVIGIGIEGGGCCGNDLVIDRNGEIIVNPLNRVIGCWTKENAYFDYCDKVERFLNGFDAFEKRFYDYIDNL